MTFLNDGEDGGSDFGSDEADGPLINTRLENVKRLKFDDQKWQIDASRFIIHGYFILIFTFIESNVRLTNSSHIFQDQQVLGEGSFGKVCLATVANESIVEGKLSAKEKEWLGQPLLPKSSRQAAVKMVKSKYK